MTAVVMTAVEWLRIKMATSSPKEMVENINAWFQKALEMEKQQIIMAYHNGYSSAIEVKPKQYEPEQYYNETYKPSA